MRTIIFCLISIALVSSKIPPNFKTCNRKDPNFKECYLEAAQHGLQQLTRPYKVFGLPNVEPLDVPFLSVKGGGGSVAVDQNFKDCQIFGLTTMKFDRFELDLEKDTLDVVGRIPEVSFKCHYNLDGKILFVPVQGDGNSSLTFKNFYITYHGQYKRVIKGNKTYYESTNADLDGTVERIIFHFDNLFNGDKQLGDNINQVLNENWEQVYLEVRPQYLEIIRKVLQGMTDRAWENVSLEEYFDN